MKLIYFAPVLHCSGGLERTLTDKANYLVGRGHEVMFLTYKQGQNKMFYDLDSRVLQVDVDCPVYIIYRQPFYARLGCYLQMKRQFRERVGRVLEEFCPDVIVITIPNTQDFIFDMMEVAHDKKIVIESHLASIHHMTGKALTERLLSMLYPSNRTIRRSDLLIALTERDADYWRRQRVPHVKVIPNPSTYYNDELQIVGKAKRRIIGVGRLYFQKRFDRLIDAFSLIAAHYPEWSVDIYGEGSLQDELQARIDRLGLTGRIRLMSVTHDIISEYQRSEFFVMSSDFEGFGLVIIEAMSCGIPVVSTDCPFGPSEIIEDGSTGLLAKMDAEDLAAKMEWMITHEVERQQMGLAAHQAAARYSQDRVMPQWEQAYLSVLEY